MVPEEEYRRWHDEMWAESEHGRDPERVTRDVVEEEMSLFNDLARQTSG